MGSTVDMSKIAVTGNAESAKMGGRTGEIGDGVVDGCRGVKTILHLSELYYTSGQAARLLGIPARTMRRFLAIGRVEGEKNPVTGTWQISRSDLVRFAEENGFAVDREPETVRIFIVHHNEKTVHWLLDILQHTLIGGCFEHSSDPCDALIRIGNKLPDVVFMSPSMPILRGREMLMSIRGFQKTKHIKVVGVSTRIDRLRDLRDLGADAILETPCASMDVLHLLQGIVPASALPEQIRSY